MKKSGVVVFDDFYIWPPGRVNYNISCNSLITDIIIHTEDVVTFLEPLDSDPNCIHKIRMVKVVIR